MTNSQGRFGENDKGDGFEFIQFGALERPFTPKKR